MSAALKMGFELLRPWGVISSVGVHNAEVHLEVKVLGSMLTGCRYLGMVTRRMARTYESRWVDAPFDPSFPRHLIC